MASDASSDSLRVPMAGLLAWAFPGLGHWYLGFRRRAVILMVTITATFWSGVAIGGVRGVIDPFHRKAWFVAELCNGGHTLVAYAIHRAIGTAEVPAGQPGPAWANWSAVDVGVIYASVAGLLNLLVILDVLMRADPQFAARAARAAKAGATSDPGPEET